MKLHSLTLSEIKNCLVQNGMNLAENDAENFINSCFAECDTQNEKGEECKEGDGLLSREEKASFFVKLYAKFNDGVRSLTGLFENIDEDAGIVYEEYNIHGNGADIMFANEDGDIETTRTYTTNGDLESIRNRSYVHGIYDCVSYYTDGPHKGRISRANGYKYEYYDNGNVKSEINSSVFPAEETFYREDGTIISKTYFEDEKYISERYHTNGELGVREITSFGELKRGMTAEEANLGMKGYLSERIIYKDNEIFLDVKYDTKGKVIDYIKNLPENELDFDENLLNGVFDADFTQGSTGVCYLAAGVKSLIQTNAGRTLLNNALNYDKETGIGTVNFSGLGKNYAFTKEEIKQAMSRLGTGDPDFTLLCLGYEKYREENNLRVDGGHAEELLIALRGAGAKTNYDLDLNRRYPIDDNMLADVNEAVNSGQGFAACGTYPSLPASGTDKGLLAGHDYYIKQMNSNVITVSDALAKKDIELSFEEFKQYFGIVEYDKVDR